MRGCAFERYGGRREMCAKANVSGVHLQRASKPVRRSLLSDVGWADARLRSVDNGMRGADSPMLEGGGSGILQPGSVLISNG